MRRTRLLFYLWMSAVLAACRPALAASLSQFPAPTPTVSTALSEPQAQTTPVPVPVADSEPPPGPSGPAIRLVLPMPGDEPVSAWRPPLYPVPWALTIHDHFYFTRPIAADEVNWPVPNYRYGGHMEGTSTVHTGIDIPAKYGTPVLAAGSGTVMWAGWGLFTGAAGDKKDPYGQAIVIRHDFGYQDHTLYTVYAHLSEIDVTEGQYVQQGSTIGQVGQTGFATGPHLHFEVRLDDSSYFTTRNPELWLAPPEGWGVLAGRVMSTGGLLLHNQQVIVRSVDNPRQFWVVYTYGPDTIHTDDYYQENFVLSDLPAGDYQMQIPYFGYYFSFSVHVDAGRVTYFIYRGYQGLSTDPPPPTPQQTP